ncbi:mevalonate kinase [Streptomyces sp. NPDC051909]|uniref:mevalonate kinase n=1 Tax=Streptomyces sp. NPDC051909 TaxID=3154944 RepID=UPI00342310D8
MGSSHGKAILLGEHAVVYGAPALAIPVPGLTVTATAQLLPASAELGEFTFTMTGSGSERVVMQTGDGLRLLASEFKKTAGITDSPQISVRISCGIPPGRGLGSSAACARAVVLALADLFDRRLDAGTVFDLVQISEGVAHGRASGIDTLATGSPTPVLLSDGVAREPKMRFDSLFVIGDSGAASLTKHAVELLQRRFTGKPGAQAEFVHRSEALTRDAVQDLAQGRIADFGARMTACHELLGSVGLSTDRIDALVDAALAAGSPGAKISGGGLGGCMIALADEPHRAAEIVTRLHKAGAERTWVVPTGRFLFHGC